MLDMRMAAMTILTLLAGCAGAASEGPAASPSVAEGPCRNEGLDPFVGRTASAELGVELLKVSGARALRWGAPGMAMTMDFRPDRLTVSYDEKMVIISARCG